jgi:hypothetical protein
MRNPKQKVRRMPILEIPWWDENERLPVLIIVVSELNNMARAVLVVSIFPFAGGSV